MNDRSPFRFLVPASFIFMTAAAATFRLTNHDIWWHLAAGRFISDGGGIPRHDPFSFTAAGVEWIDHEWLFQLLVHGLHAAGGVPALILFKAGLIAITALLVFAFVRREGGLEPAIAALLLVPFVLAGRDRFIVRPEIFTLFFSALLLTALQRRRGKPATLRTLWWVPPLFAVWANLHGGMIVGLVLLALFALGRWLPCVWRVGGRSGVPAEGRPSAATALGLLAAGTVCGLFNPFVYRVYEVPFRLTALIESGIYQNLEWIRPPWPASWLFYLLLLFSGLVLGMSLRRPDWSAIFPLLFLGAIAFQYVRNLALFSLLAPVLLTRILISLRGFEERPADRSKAGGPLGGLRAALAVPVLVFLGIFLLAGGYRFASGLGVDPRRVPAGAVDFVEQANPPGNMINAYAYGGYITWRLWPRNRIFIDGRNEVFADLRRRLGKAVTDSRLWNELLDDYDIGFALLEYIDRSEAVTLVDPAGGPPRVVRRPYAVNHFPRSGWALVHWDDTAMVFVRRGEETASLVESHEYRHVFPESVPFQEEAIRLGWADRQACLEELASKIRQDPSCRRALALYDAVGRSAMTGPARAPDGTPRTGNP